MINSSNPCLQIAPYNFNKITPELYIQSIKIVTVNLAKCLNKIASQNKPITWSTIQDVTKFKFDEEHSKMLLSNLKNISSDWQEVKFGKIRNDVLEILGDKSDIAYQKLNNFLSSELSKTDITSENKALGLKYQREFILDVGGNLSVENKKEFDRINDELDDLQSQFKDNHKNLLDSFSYIVKPQNVRKELSGLPPHILQTLKQQDGNYKVSLDKSVYTSIMENCSNRRLRERLYKSNECIENGNTELIVKILALRQEKAKLLVNGSFAKLALKDNIINQPQQVINLLSSTFNNAYIKAKQDYDLLVKYAKYKFNIQKLEPWDIDFVANALYKDKIGFNETEIQKYFTVDSVTSGSFKLLEKLYNIKIRPEKSAATPHSDIECFSISNKQGKKIAYFYLDLFIRDKKVKNSLSVPADYKEKDCLPSMVIYCNFKKSNTNTNNSTASTHLTHSQVKEFLHELGGHGMQHLLTSVNGHMINGMENTEWDIIEFNPKFMEKFCYDYEIMKQFSCQTNSSSKKYIPQDLFNSIIKSKEFLSAFIGKDAILQRLALAMVDINLNHSSQTFTVDNIHDEARKIYQQYQLIPISDKSLFLNNFIHAFAGTGYESIFYSYILADIVGAQLHKKFADSGDLENTELMQKYHNQFLSKGATINANQALTSFLGEGINSKAFLEFYGLG